MSAIWQLTESGGWKLLDRTGFQDELALHRLVERSPEILPLSGKPHLVVLGREVVLGGNKADLIGVETTGRPVVLEVKLAQNAESRRAVAAQVLTYAAFLHRLPIAQSTGSTIYTVDLVTGQFTPLIHTGVAFVHNIAF